MRLINFLGTGNYRETTYSLGSSTRRTRYVAYALASFFQPDEIRIVATTEAAEQHWQAVSDLLRVSGFANVQHSWIPTTGEPENLWKTFATVVDLIRHCPDGVVFDITHGFRAHPFFAAACIEYVQSVLPDPPQIRMVYGEYRETEEKSPVWELTPFLEVLSWSRSLMMFLRTGQADEVVAPTEALGRELSRQWAMSGRQGTQPQLRSLAQALADFGNDFTTVRTGSLFIGDHPSAGQLWNAIERTKNEVAHQLPTLALVLNQVQGMVEPLRTGGARLSSPVGQRALKELASLYHRLGRYAEAAATIREAWITKHACQLSDCPGHSDFNREHREAAEKAWYEANPLLAQEIADPRNDIQHAGYNKCPQPSEKIKRKIKELIDRFDCEGAPIDV